MKRYLSYLSTDVLEAADVGRHCETSRKSHSRERAGVAARLVLLSTVVASALGVFYFHRGTSDFQDTLRFLQYNGPPSGNGPSRDGDGLYGEQPSKGNTDCVDLRLPGQADRNPCHYDETVPTPSPPSGNRQPPPTDEPDMETAAPPDTGDTSDGDTNSSSILQDRPFPPRAPENIVNLTIFVAQEPRTQSVAHRVAKILTNEMNRTIENMMFYNTRDTPRKRPRDKDPPFDEELDGGEEPVVIGTRQVNNINNSTTEPPAQDQEGSDPFQGQQLIPGNNRTASGGLAPQDGSESSVPTMPVRDQRFNMIYVRTSSFVTRQDPGVRWWWELDVFYLCFWEDTDGPVGQGLMDAIRVNMTEAIRQKLDEIESIVRNDTRREELLVKLDIPGNVSDPVDDPVVDPGITPLDVGEWSWTRYLGFTVLLVTCSGLILASQVGAIRRRRKTRHDVWGNLASEEGVKELLNTGWILRDDRMEVYDKTRVGYRDDDSMLIGGFEQREPGPGTEIVTPTLTTHEDTSTRGGPSTTPRPVSTRQEDP